jgi:hypothetical protein
MFAQRCVQHLAEHYLTVFQSFAADSDNHSFAVNVADSHIGQLSAPHSGGIQRHQDYTVKREISGFDQKTDFFGTHDLGQIDYSFWIGRLRGIPWPMQSLNEEETQGSQALIDCIGGQFPVTEQMSLVDADMLQT